MIMIEMQYSSTALLLLVNPCILHQNNGLSYINYCPKMLCCQLCATHYTTLRINKITSAIKVAPMKISDDFHFKWKPSCAYHKIDTFYGEQRSDVHFCNGAGTTPIQLATCCGTSLKLHV